MLFKCNLISSSVLSKLANVTSAMCGDINLKVRLYG